MGKYYRHDDSAELVPIVVDGANHIMSVSAVYIIDAADAVWIWEGADVEQRDVAVQVAQRQVKYLQTHEGSCAGACRGVKQDEEPSELRDVLKALGFLMPSEATAVVPMETEPSDLGEHQHTHKARSEDEDAPRQREQAQTDVEISSHRVVPEEAKRSMVSFPEGGLPCEVQTPRGERPPMSIPGFKLAPTLAPTAEHAEEAGWRKVSNIFVCESRRRLMVLRGLGE